MELYQLYYFKAIAESRSFTRAAEGLHVSQSSVTKAIQKLESDISVRLFDRQNKQIELTEEGVFFYDQISKILLSLELAVNETQCLASTLQGTVRINVPPNIGAELLTLLTRYYTPNIANSSVQIIDTGCMAAWEMILEEKIELGWAMGIYVPPEITFQEVETQEFFLATSSDHPLAKQLAAPTFEDLRDEIFLIMNTAPNLSTTKMLEERCLEAGYRPISGLKNINIAPSPQIIQRWVEQGLGITFLPEPIAKTCTRLHIRSMEPPLKCSVGISWKTSRPLSSSAKRLKDFIITEYNNRTKC